MKTLYLTIIHIAILLLGFNQTVMAHDPGTSYAKLDILNDKLDLKMSFALSDIETLAVINTDGDSQFSQAEMKAAHPGLTELIAAGVQAYDDNRRLVAENSDFSIENNENLIVRLQFSAKNSGNVSLHLPILKKLTRGHRQYMLVNDGNDSYQNVLSANSKPVNVDVDKVKPVNVLILYFAQGIDHIFAGFDHMLFLLTLILPGVLIYNKNNYQGTEKLMPALIDTFKIITAFTLAHSITLALAVFQVIQLPGRLVESVIAFSIIVCALNNLKPILPASRWSLAFGFGLIHGFGFANALVDLGIESKQSLIPLMGFNLGIETGQLVIVSMVLPVLYFIRNSIVFRVWIFRGGSIASILIASGWMLERTL